VLVVHWVLYGRGLDVMYRRRLSAKYRLLDGRMRGRRRGSNIGCRRLSMAGLGSADLVLWWRVPRLWWCCFALHGGK
jgi:hypothetical protein